MRILSNAALACLLTLLTFALLQPAVSRQANIAFAPADTVAGDWVGRFQSYPVIVDMTLSIQPPDASGTSTGSLRLEPADGARNGPMGVTTVSVRFDRASQTLTIIPGAEARQVRLGNITFHGYLAGSTGVIGGVMSNSPSSGSPYFILARRGNEAALGKASAGGSRSQSNNPLQKRFGIFNQVRGYDQDRLFAWAQRFVDEYPDVDAMRTEYGRLFAMARNLYADEHFSEHFGKTFDEMGANERSRIYRELNKITPPRSNFPEERVNGVLRGVNRGFMDAVATYASPDIELSIAAMRPIEQWRIGMRQVVAEMDDTAEGFSAATSVRAAVERLEAYWWPSDYSEFVGSVEDDVQRIATRPLEQQVDALIAGASGIAGARTLQGAIDLRPSSPDLSPSAHSPAASARTAGRRATRAGGATTSTARSRSGAAVPSSVATTAAREPTMAELAGWAPETWAALQPRLRDARDSLVSDVARTARQDARFTALQGGAPRQRVTTGRDWYFEYYALFNEFAGNADVAELRADFRTHRNEAMTALLPELSAELDRLDSSEEVESLGDELIIDLDLAQSSAWRTFENQRSARIVELEREAFAELVGDGPFGVDYPGAIYLNALYRNDQARLNQVDKSIADPLADLFREIMDGTGFSLLLSGLSESTGSGVDLMALLDAEYRRYTLSGPLAAFFIVAYERVYPECMDENPIVHTKTIVWETVVRNGFGMEISRYPSGSQTNSYMVNRRHNAAFRRVGSDQASPEAIDFTAALFGEFVPVDLRKPLRTTSDTLRGLRMAMTNLDCNSDTIRRIEKTMIDRVMSR